MRSLAVLLALALSIPACAAATDSGPDESASSEEDPITLATDTKIKNAVEKTTKDHYFLSESDHPLVWIRSAKVEPRAADAALVHAAFNKITDGDSMADKPLAQMHSETVSFESFASRYVPIAGEDEDNFVYHQQLTATLNALRTNLKNPVVIRMGRKSWDGKYLVGAISVYIIGTLPSGKIGGLFTVAVET